MNKNIFKLIILSIVFITNVYSKDISSNNILNTDDIRMINNVMVKKALDFKNYDDLTTIAISFYATSLNENFKGDRNSLKNRAFELLKLASYNKNLRASLFIITNFMKTNPNTVYELSKRVLKRNLIKEENGFSKVAYSFVSIYTVLALEHHSTSIEDMNLALDSIDMLKKDSSLLDLYRAFIFKSLDSESLATTYLTKACSSKEHNKKVFEFCNGKDVNVK